MTVYGGALLDSDRKRRLTPHPGESNDQNLWMVLGGGRTWPGGLLVRIDDQQRTSFFEGAREPGAGGGGRANEQDPLPRIGQGVLSLASQRPGGLETADRP